MQQFIDFLLTKLNIFRIIFFADKDFYLVYSIK